ncbi:MAG: enoyl-CoA hydratase/isomerase family protein [bacterium]|nr:enoyl-CoA hydratase/isomerase family protein [bacterium]
MTTNHMHIVDRGDVLRLHFDTPILSRHLLTELADTIEQLALKPSSQLPIVLCSDHPTIFLAGAHLNEIAKLKWNQGHTYAQAGRRTLRLIATYARPVVAAVHGTCAGGGFDLALHCDRIVAGRSALFSHPGARRGLVTGWRGSAIIKSLMRKSQAKAVLVEGRHLTADDLSETTLVLSTLTDPVRAAEREARRLTQLHPDRLSLWRGLKTGSFIDRFRAFMVHNDV